MSDVPRDTAQEILELKAKIAELEQALRLHLAVSPDDPLLIEPVEQRLVRAEADLKGQTERALMVLNQFHAVCAEKQAQAETIRKLEGVLNQYKDLVSNCADSTEETLKPFTMEQLRSRLLYLASWARGGLLPQRNRRHLV